MRLIDADVCEEEMLYEMCGTGYQSKAMYVVRHAETVDAVPVVRCKDCKRRDLGTRTYEWCSRFDCYVMEDDFCSWAERKES